MFPLRYFLAALVSSSGLFAGVLIAGFAKEELNPGRPFFDVLLRLLIAVCVGVVAYYSVSSFMLRMLTYLAAIAVLAFFRIDGVPAYFLLGLLFYLSSSHPAFLVVASAVFVFGLVSGSIHFQRSFRGRLSFSRRMVPLLLDASAFLFSAAAGFAYSYVV